MTPLISVVIPTYNRPAELRACLSGFASQSVGPEQFEVVIADDGSDQDAGEVAAPFRNRLDVRVERCDHAGVSVARNRAISCSRAALLLLYDDDLRPLPGLIESCLQFHSQFEGIHETALARFVPGPEIAAMAVVRWAFDELYPFPGSAGVYTWRSFWSGTVTCKRALFEEEWFDPEFPALEDTEFALRVSRRLPLAVHYGTTTFGHFCRQLDVRQICGRQYRMGYYRYLMSRRHDLHFEHPVCDKPHEFVIPDWPAYRTLLSALRPQESATLDTDSSRYRMLWAVWQKASLHSTASGWLAAQAGGSAQSTLFE